MPEPAETTWVDLIWLKDRLQRWVRFGQVAEEIVHDRRRRTVGFKPGSIFALIHWEAGDYGTTLSRLWVLRAVRPDKPCDQLPFVSPGVEIMLDIKTWVKVRTALDVIDTMEAQRFRPEDVCPDHWRHVGGRISVAEPPSPYTRARHRAWLSRKRLGLIGETNE